MNYLDRLRLIKEKGMRLFSLREFCLLTGLSPHVAQITLGRYRQKGLVKRPKRGLYYFVEFPPSDFGLANRMYSPSYISLETVLSQEGIIPETVYSVTSVAPKSARSFVVDGKVFEYSKIKPVAFTGYFKKEEFLIAEPEKALVDYLYLASLGKRRLSERLYLDKLDQEKIKRYVELYNNRKLKKLVKRL